MKQDTRYYTVPQVSNILQIHQNTVKRYLKEGVLQGFKINRRGDWRIPESEITRFVNQTKKDSEILTQLAP